MKRGRPRDVPVPRRHSRHHRLDRRPDPVAAVPCPGPSRQGLWPLGRGGVGPRRPARVGRCRHVLVGIASGRLGVAEGPRRRAHGQRRNRPAGAGRRPGGRRSGPVPRVDRSGAGAAAAAGRREGLGGQLRYRLPRAAAGGRGLRPARHVARCGGQPPHGGAPSRQCGRSGTSGASRAPRATAGPRRASPCRSLRRTASWHGGWAGRRNRCASAHQAGHAQPLRRAQERQAMSAHGDNCSVGPVPFVDGVTRDV
jgi:hypothetical protein